MVKKRLYEIAKEAGKDNAAVFELAKKLGYEVKTHSSSLDEEEALKIRKILLGHAPMPDEKKDKISSILRKAKKSIPSQEVVGPSPPPAADSSPSSFPTPEQPKVVSHIPPPVSPPHQEQPPSHHPLPAVSPPIVSSPAPHHAQEVGQLASADVQRTPPPVQSPIPAGPQSPVSVTTERPQTVSTPSSIEQLAKKKKKKGLRPPPEVQILQKKVVVKKEEPLPTTDYKLFDYYDTATLYPLPLQRKKKRVFPKKGPKKPEETAPLKAQKRILKVQEGITVGALSQRIGIKVSDLIRKLMDIGVMATVNQSIDPETADLVAKEYGFTVEKISFQPQDLLDQSSPSSPESLQHRPPVVTVMGHVDHGKTTLLDAIRQTRVAESEAGGITQHIGASTVDINGKKIVFLDTPGHEAFTAMRARGARATDVVVLVVAADEGLMPQTQEAISHAQAAHVPIVVAINKIDKPGSNPQQVMTQLSDKGLTPEKWGGDTLYAALSAKQKKGINELLDLILLQADVLDLKADPKKNALGVVIEARLDKGRGPVATLLIKEGTLRVGDPIVVGSHGGKVRAMLDDRGTRLAEAGPSIPVEVIGLSGVPKAGETFSAVKDEDVMRQLIKHEEDKLKTPQTSVTAKITLEDMYKQMEQENMKQLALILKTDVMGSSEAIQEALKKLPTDTIKVSVIHSGAGAITASDVMLASASNAIIIGFNVRPDPKAAEFAQREKIEIRTYTIIYELISDIKKAMEGLLEPTLKEKIVGRASVKQPFTIGKVGTIAGSLVVDGKIVRGMSARVLRDSIAVYSSRVSSLRRFKDDVKEVLSGLECGIGIDKFNDIKAGDVIEVYEMEKIFPKLDEKS